MSNLFIFRRYKKKQGKKNVKHPKLIVDEYLNEFGFMGLTSSPSKGRRHKNIPLDENPQIINGKRNSKKSYLRRKIEYDNKKNFHDVSSDYVLSDSDKRKIIPYVNKHKKKR